MVNRPEASVVAWPSAVGCPSDASNKVTLTLESGCAEAVPPVWTTPLSEAGLADEIARVAIKIDAAAITTRAVMNMNVLIETVPLSLTIDSGIISISNKVICCQRVSIQVQRDEGFNRKCDVMRAKRHLRNLESKTDAQRLPLQQRFVFIRVDSW